LGGKSIAEEVTSGGRKKKINAEDHRGKEGAEKEKDGREGSLFTFLLSTLNFKLSTSSSG
jgi:hypothetical protein